MRVWALINTGRIAQIRFSDEKGEKVEGVVHAQVGERVASAVLVLFLFLGYMKSRTGRINLARE